MERNTQFRVRRTAFDFLELWVAEGEGRWYRLGHDGGVLAVVFDGVGRDSVFRALTLPDNNITMLITDTGPTLTRFAVMTF